MSAEGVDTSTPAIAEHLLETLRLLDRADDRWLSVQNGGAYGDVHEALIKVLHTQGWGHRMADEAILLAMTDNISMREAMLATRAG